MRSVVNRETVGLDGTCLLLTGSDAGPLARARARGCLGGVTFITVKGTLRKRIARTLGGFRHDTE